MANQTSSSSSSPFTRVLIKVRVNPRKVAMLKEAGVHVAYRSEERGAELRQNHAAQRGEKHYVRGGERTNSAGEKIGDSGHLRISFNKPENGQVADATKTMSIEKAIEELEAVGYRFQNCHVVMKETEPNGMGTFVIVMVISSNESETQPLTKQAADLIQEMTTAMWRSVFVWENQDGSCTLNSNHSMVGVDLERATDRRMLRFRFEDGRTYWESAKQ